MKSFGEFLNEQKESLNEVKGEEGKYYSIELPNKANEYQAKLAGGPFKSFEEAKRKGGSRSYGLNQSHEIGMFYAGQLVHVDTDGEPREKTIASNVGKSVKKIFN